MSYLFISESIIEGHPDKLVDQISDVLVDNFLAFDPNSKVACETLLTTGQVVLASEVKSNTYLDSMAHPSFVMSNSFTNETLTQSEKLRRKQADYIGVKFEEPYKPEHNPY